MITFNTQFNVNESNIDKALDKFMAAQEMLSLPLVITDTWFRDGKPIPHQLVANAMWAYEKKHAGRHPGISFVVGDPGQQTLLSHLTQVCKVEERTVRDAIDKAMNDLEARGFSTPRYSLKDHVLAIESGEGKQAREFAKIIDTARNTGRANALAHQLKHYQHYFDVITWQWVYNTVRFT